MSSTASRLLVLVAALPMVVAALALDPLGFFTGDAGIKYLQARAFASPGEWPRAVSWPAADVDPGMRWLPLSLAPVDGRPVSLFPYPYPLAAAALEPVAGDRSLRLVAALAALAAAFFTGLLARRLGGRMAAGAALALAATPLAFYGAAVWEHSLLAAVAMACLLALARALEEGGGWRGWILVGLLAGAAGWVRSEGFILVALAGVPLVAAGRERVRPFGAAVAGAVAGLGLGSWVQHLVLGAWLPVHLTANVTRRGVFSGPFLENRWSNLRMLFVPDLWCALAVAAWIVALVLALRPRDDRVSAAARTGGLVAVGSALVAAVVAPAVRVLMGSSPAEAFPVASATAAWVALSAVPLVLAVGGGSHTASGIRVRRVVGSAAALYTLVYVVGSPLGGAFQWGARIFLPVALVLAALLAAGLGRKLAGDRIAILAVVAAVAAGVAVQLLGVAFLAHVTRGHREFTRTLERTTADGEVVVTDTHYLPELGAPLWERRRFLLLRGPEDPPDLVARLAGAGIGGWTWASCDDSNLGLTAPVRAAAAGGGWEITALRTVRTGGRTLALLRFSRPGSPTGPDG